MTDDATPRDALAERELRDDRVTAPSRSFVTSLLLITVAAAWLACSSSDTEIGQPVVGAGSSGAGATGLGGVGGMGGGPFGGGAGKGGNGGAAGGTAGAGASGASGKGTPGAAGTATAGAAAAGASGAAGTATAGAAGAANAGAAGTAGASDAAAVPAPIHGVTVTDDQDIRDTTSSYLTDVLTSLEHLERTPTTRIVYTRSTFGASGAGDPADSYAAATKAIKAKGYVMGQPVDSVDQACYTVAQSKARFSDYVSTLGASVDIWEIANEINGEWLYTEGGGVAAPCTPAVSAKTTQADVVQKMKDAYAVVKTAGRAAALTLFYNDPSCYGAPAANRMTPWVEQHIPVGDPMRAGLDYVIVSWYELDSGCPALTVAEWQTLYDALAAVFPNAKVGVAEFGYASGAKPSDAVLTDLITRTYAVRPKGPRWVGGGFFWNFSVDAVPFDAPAHNAAIWGAVNQGLIDQY